MYIHDDEDVVADTLKSKPTPHRGSFEMIENKNDESFNDLSRDWTMPHDHPND